MRDDLTLGEAAKEIGVSVDTLRRWERAGRLRTKRDARNRRLVSRREVNRLSRRPTRHRAGDALSARNRFPGRIVDIATLGALTRVTIDIEGTPLVAALTTRSAEELEVAPGLEVYASFKAMAVHLC